MRGHRYHPWRALRGLPHLTIRWSSAVARGRVDGHTITLHPLLTQAERRSTLAHELVHLERGPVSDWAWPREELVVEEIAVVEQAMTLTRGGAEFRPPKTRQALRRLPVGDVVIDAIARHLEQFPCEPDEACQRSESRAPAVAPSLPLQVPER